MFSRTRNIFIGIMGIAVLFVGIALLFNFVRNNNENGSLEAQPTLLPQTIPEVVVTAVPEENNAVTIESPPPIFAPTADLNDGLPTYICAADAFGSYFTLQQMQMSGTDVEHGFHLGIVPFVLDDDPAYDVSEQQRSALLESGGWNCLLTTLDSVALSGAGVVTAIVDESAGADQLWAKEINTINELSGKTIAYSEGSVGEYFVYYALSIARLNPRFDVTLLPEASVADAVAAFNEGRADVVSGWEPDIYDAELGGGVPLLSSSQMRIVVDVVVTSRQSIDQNSDLVQSFHNAWFDTLKDQVEDFDRAAAQIAQWGHNDWSFIYPETAADDFQIWLENVAQADLEDNAIVMSDPLPIINRLDIARRVWAASGAEVPSDQTQDLVNTDFVANAFGQTELRPGAGTPVNDSFSISANLDLSGVSTDDAATLAVLPCRRFSFVPESTELTLESRRILDDCVAPTLTQSVGLFLKVNGSSAWPGPAGAFTEQEILDFAEARAQSVVDYLVGQGIDPTRFIVEVTLPPEERRETEDPEAQALDRYVEMTLLTVGR